MAEPVVEDQSLVPSQRRLQRPPDFTGGRLSSFRAVFLRHGLPGALLGLICLLYPDMRSLLLNGSEAFLANPVRYVTTGVVIFGGLTAYAWYLDKKIDLPRLGWIVYLLCLSAWEEWVFRLALPYFAEQQGVELRVAVVVSSLAFGAIHYFTLRWRWQWCLGAFLGSLALSRQMEQHFDLALIIGIHWIATFINTPRLPGRSRNSLVIPTGSP